MPDEPDARMSLAAERTSLAYLRTGLALLAAGVAVATALPDAGVQVLRRVLGLVLVLLGLAVTVLSRVRYQRVDEAMRAGQPLPAPPLGALVAGLVLVTAGAVAVVLLG